MLSRIIGSSLSKTNYNNARTVFASSYNTNNTSTIEMLFWIIRSSLSKIYTFDTIAIEMLSRII
jgi:hypothetical protein